MLKSVVKEMLRTWNTVFSSTPTDGVDVNQSDTERATQMGDLQHFSSPSSHLSADSGRNAVHRSGAVINRDGWFQSCIICVNILILGCALVSGSAFNSVAITAVHRQVFVIILLILTMIWMVVYAVLTSRRNQTVLFKDSHAGPVWLRVGLLVFGLLSLLMDIFKIANYVGYLHCDSAVKVALPVVQAVFLFVQTYFLWIHAKDCVQQYTVFSRCGLTLTLSTNLVVWMAAVTEESVHHTEIPHVSTHMSYKSYRASHGDTKCKCSHSACDTFKEAFFYLYPFNIEYSLFASAMAYVMWKNVGRIVEDHGHHKAKFHLKEVFFGPVAGIIVAIIGLITFILYELDIDTDNKEKRDKALLMHFAMNIVIVSLMSICTVVGCIVYRLDRREQMSEKNPTRNLDVGLLIGASMGQIVISYFTIVAVVATGAKGYLNALNLALAVVVVVQLGLQNYFIIEGLHREPFHVMQEATLQNNCPTSQEQSEVNVPVDNGSDLTSSSKRPNWKRKVLKEVCAFLLLANVILWIMPAFGARPQFDHYVEMHFYKYTMWTTIVNIGLPFGIFYRMHCIASLFEVYMIS